MKRFFFLILCVSFLSSCNEDNTLLTPVSVNPIITSEYLLDGNLDVYIQNSQVFRYTGKPGIEIIPIGNENLSDYEDCFVLYIASGKDATAAVSSAIVKLDGIVVLNASDFSNNLVLHTFEICNLTEQSVLEVEVRGAPGSFIDLWIEGKLKELTVTDCDGNKYKTVKIGEQIWMAENLRTTHYNDCSPISLVTDNLEWSSLNSGAYCYYENDFNSYGTVYGSLYNWYAVNTDKLCPVGWHVPSTDEWKVLTTYLGTNPGYKLRETGYSHWSSWVENVTNSSGFTALPGGFRYSMGGFTAINYQGQFWTSSRNIYSTWQVFGIVITANACSRDSYTEPNGGLSIRCIKDN